MPIDRRSFISLAPAVSVAASTRVLTGCSSSSAASAEFLVPDLEDGCIVFNSGGNSGGTDATNEWITTIECVLQWLPPQGDVQSAYLGHECRAEGLRDAPFDDRGNYEFVGIKSWDGNYLVRSGVDLAPEEEYQKLSPELVQAGFDFVAIAPSRPAQTIAFDRLVEDLRSISLASIGRTYMRLNYQSEGARYALLSRCKYINFPHRSYPGRPYLQPICGRVMIWHEDRLKLAYVAVHILGSVVQGLQFKVRDPVNYGQTFRLTDFARTVTIDAETAFVDFFCYG